MQFVVIFCASTASRQPNCICLSVHFLCWLAYLISHIHVCGFVKVLAYISNRAIDFDPYGVSFNLLTQWHMPFEFIVTQLGEYYYVDM